MQFLLTISLGLLTFCCLAFSWPQEDEMPYDAAYSSYPQGRGAELQQDNYDIIAGSQENDPQLPEDEKKELLKQLGKKGNGMQRTFFQELPKDVAEELRTQLSAAREGGEAEMESTSNGRVLKHGSAIALQLVENDRWLSCNRVKYCATEPCPGLFFDRPDGVRCRGEAFWIYRAAGPGNICTGDFVGLYYRSNTWFSMKNKVGQRSYCPGRINSYYGFNSYAKWCTCGAEIFQVYVKGKGIGATITDQDTIALYYPCGKTFVQFRNTGQCGSTCMLQKSGYSRPPSNSAFDQCKGDSVELTIFR